MKILVVTGTRAEFGLLQALLVEIQASPKLDLELVVTGSHLLSKFGMTINLIEDAGFKVGKKVSATRDAKNGAEVGIQVGKGITEFVSVFESTEPSVVLVVGDRYETFAAAVAAFFLEIPIVHVHGGEVTRGALDDSLRHAITKLASVHCVSHPAYASRVIQLGEQPDSVHVVGSLGVDQLSGIVLKNRAALEADLGISLRAQIFLVTYHPVTNGERDSSVEARALVEALEAFPEATVVLSMPNADPGHEAIAGVLQEAAELNPGKWYFFPSLGQINYWSLMAISTAVVGNSSSGILEAPFFSVPTVNVGPRQDGRVSAPSVLNCDPSKVSLLKALRRASSKEFRDSIPVDNNPYTTGGAAKSIRIILESMSGKQAGRKIFYDALRE